jgi:hypothetical protein
MATINRSSTILDMAENLALNTGIEKIPVNLKEDVQAVYRVNPSVSKVCKWLALTTTTATTMYTTPVNKDFYLTSIWIGFTKDVTSDLMYVCLRFVVDGQAKDIGIRGQTLTAESKSMSLSFPFPIKIDKGTIMQMVGAFAAGACAKDITFTGYILE